MRRRKSEKDGMSWVHVVFNCLNPRINPSSLLPSHLDSQTCFFAGKNDEERVRKGKKERKKEERKETESEWREKKVLMMTVKNDEVTAINGNERKKEKELNPNSTKED